MLFFLKVFCSHADFTFTHCLETNAAKDDSNKTYFVQSEHCFSPNRSRGLDINQNLCIVSKHARKVTANLELGIKLMTSELARQAATPLSYIPSLTANELKPISVYDTVAII